MGTGLPVTGILHRLGRPRATNVDIAQTPSPNFGKRRGGVIPDMIVLHYTAMATAGAAQRRLCDPACQVSAHYLIGPEGAVVQMVQEDQRAWHAGAGRWGACDDINSRSIGIELANDGSSPFAAAQMDALEQLMMGVMARWPIPPERVIGHSDMAPGRKSDPGARFDWQRLARQGLSVWPDENLTQDHDPGRFRDFATTIGYSETHSDTELLAAFRLRFRPWGGGPVDVTDLALAQNIACRFPVDLPVAST